MSHLGLSFSLDPKSAQSPTALALALALHDNGKHGHHSRRGNGRIATSCFQVVESKSKSNKPARQEGRRAGDGPCYLSYQSHVVCSARVVVEGGRWYDLGSGGHARDIGV